MRGLSLSAEDDLTSIVAEQTDAALDDPTPRIVAAALGGLLRLAYGTLGWPHMRARRLARQCLGLRSRSMPCSPVFSDMAKARTDFWLATGPNPGASLWRHLR
jgi:hypothetical protein